MAESLVDHMISLALAGGGAAGVWSLLGGVAKARGERQVALTAANAPAALVTAAAAFQQALTAEAERLVGDLRGRIESLEKANEKLTEACAVATRAHDACTAEVAALRALLEAKTFGPPLPAYHLGSSRT